MSNRTKRSKRKKTIRPKILVLEGLFSDTAEIVDDAGGDGYEVMPWDLADVDEKLAMADGIILTGGSDINPALYGEKPHSEVYGIDNVRDTVEWYALDYALNSGIPVLGICRGSQIMCAYRGGSLEQHIQMHRGGSHSVHAVNNAKTFKRAIAGRSMSVISLHHQCVRQPGKGMRIAAYAGDGTPEAIESHDGMWLGVQYHPEMAAYQNGQAFAIFQWLVRTAARNMGCRADVPTFTQMREHRQFAAAYIRDYSGSSYSGTTTIGKWETLTDEEKDAYLGTSSESCAIPKAEAKNRQAGTRPFAEASGVSSSKPTFGHDNPCPCPDEGCVWGFKCGASVAKSAEESAGVFVGHFENEGTEHHVGEDNSFNEDRELLFICPSCAMMFDCKQDRDDHVSHAICRSGEVVPGAEVDEQFELDLARRYPELEPPAGHEAWEDDDGSLIETSVLTDDEIAEAMVPKRDNTAEIAQRVLAQLDE